MGKIERCEVNAALDRQRETDACLGDILVRTGLVAPTDLKCALETQKLLRSRSAYDRAIGATMLSKISSGSVSTEMDNINIRTLKVR